MSYLCIREMSKKALETAGVTNIQYELFPMALGAPTGIEVGVRVHQEVPAIKWTLLVATLFFYYAYGEQTNKNKLFREKNDHQRKQSAPKNNKHVK